MPGLGQTSNWCLWRSCVQRERHRERMMQHYKAARQNTHNTCRPFHRAGTDGRCSTRNTNKESWEGQRGKRDREIKRDHKEKHVANPTTLPQGQLVRRLATHAPTPVGTAQPAPVLWTGETCTHMTNAPRAGGTWGNTDSSRGCTFCRQQYPPAPPQASVRLRTTCTAGNPPLPSGFQGKPQPTSDQPDASHQAQTGAPTATPLQVVPAVSLLGTCKADRPTPTRLHTSESRSPRATQVVLHSPGDRAPALTCT